MWKPHNMSKLKVMGHFKFQLSVHSTVNSEFLFQEILSFEDFR